MISCDPNDLMAAAKCFRCIPKGMQREVQIYLLCQIAGGGGNEVPENLTLPTIIGTVQVGADISGTDGTWEGSPTSFAYQWFADGAEIVGETSNTYLVTAAEIGKVITFQVIATNATGDSLPAVSAGSAPVPDPADVIVNAWDAQVIANGGAAPSVGTKNALKTFVGALTTANILVKMHVVNCIVPDNAIAALTPQLKGTGFALWVDKGTLSANLTVDGFHTAGGGIRYADTGIIPDVEFSNANSTGMSVYIYNGTADGPLAGVVLGCIGVDYMYIVAGGNTNVGYYSYDPLNSLFVNGLINTFSFGYISCNRVSASDQQVYTARSNIPWASRGSYAGAPHTLPVLETMGFLALHQGANFSQQPGVFCSFVAVHDGLSSAEGQAFFNAVQALRTSLGGGFG